MDKTLVAALLVLCLAPVALAVTCEDGFYSNTGSDGNDYCFQCTRIYTKCGTSIELNSAIDGATVDSSGVLTAKCNVGSAYWNPDDEVCQDFCKEGCIGCSIDYDFCTSCDDGYVWSDDSSCAPITLGLEAAYLAFLIIGLIISIVACMRVNSAKK